MATLQLDDLDLHYERFGEGRPLLVLSGSGASIETSRPLIDRLARDAEVLVHDQRGLGRTGLPRGTDAPTMADYAADAIALVDHVGWDTFAVFGVSFGGMVAQELAVTHPERVERLVLVCTSPGGQGGSSHPLHELADLPPEERTRHELGLVDTRFDEAWLRDHPADRAIAAMMAERAAAPRTDEERLGERLQLESRRHHDVWDRLDLVTCPTLIACGEHDGIAPPANSEAIHRRIANSELHRYDGGHLFLYQDPRAFRDIAGFLTA
ncbi:MAG: alpha/beta hydrolase [Ilumatobacteraceae bacterium]